MKKYLLVLLLFVSFEAMGQEKYIYNNLGALKYVVKDTLSTSNTTVGDLFVETTKKMVGSYIYHKKSARYLITDETEFKHICTTHEATIFDKTISRKSVNSFLKWLYYIKERYSIQDINTQYTFTDESLEFTFSIVPLYGKLYVVCDGKEFRIEFLDSFIPNIEKIQQILEENQDAYSI